MDNSTNNMSEKLVQYLDGELTGAERENFEKLLATDDGLQNELQSLKETREAVMQFGLQQQVAGIHTEMMQEMQPPVRKINSSRKIFRYSMAVAASLLLIIGGYFALNFYSLSSNKVFASNYHSYELSTMRDDDTVQISSIEKAYREKNYKEVIVLSEQQSTVSVKETFLTAMSYVEQGNNIKAIEQFKKVITANNASGAAIMNDEAEYYLALTYIRNKDFDFALELLRTIKDNPDHIYHGKITAKLIRQVKMLKWR
jgi:tetratricopeptide (TPR) repeat protein